jgi:hypothetical protein
LAYKRQTSDTHKDIGLLALRADAMLFAGVVWKMLLGRRNSSLVTQDFIFFLLMALLFLSHFFYFVPAPHPLLGLFTSSTITLHT